MSFQISSIAPLAHSSLNFTIWHYAPDEVGKKNAYGEEVSGDKKNPLRDEILGDGYFNGYAKFMKLNDLVLATFKGLDDPDMDLKIDPAVCLFRVIETANEYVKVELFSFGDMDNSELANLTMLKSPNAQIPGEDIPEGAFPSSNPDDTAPQLGDEGKYPQPAAPSFQDAQTQDAEDTAEDDSTEADGDDLSGKPKRGRKPKAL